MELQPKHKAYQKGEKLTYRIHYSFITAGVAGFEVKDTLLNLRQKPHFFFDVYGRSIKRWDRFYKVRDRYYSIVDTQTLLPTIAYRDIQEGKYETTEKMIFNRKANTVKINDTLQKKTEPDVHDIVSAIYYARNLNVEELKIGEGFHVETFFEAESFPIDVVYFGKETIKTKLGKFRCMVFRPKLIEGRVFKDQSDMVVYVSDDKNRIPIRIESGIFVGSIQVDLSDFKGVKYPFDSRVSDD